MKIGLIINPIAGVGAALAWKGTDNIEQAWDIVEKNGEQPVWNIAQRALYRLSNDNSIFWYFGGDYEKLCDCKLINTDYEIVYNLPKRSSAIDTKKAVKQLINKNVDLIVFVGGDGTAKDVGSSVEYKIPIIGIPGGVKIFSPSFIHRPEDLYSFIKQWNGEVREVDILDLDEQEYKRGYAKPKIVGSCLIPVTSYMQSGKMTYSTSDSSVYVSIAERILDDNLLDNKNIIVGPGSTMKRIFENLKINISLLGVDIISNKKLIKADCTKFELINYFSKNRLDEIWISPIGNQGHIFGRGNRQISSSLISKITKEQIIIFATPEKIFNTKTLYIDTGDSNLDKKLQGYYNVIVGYHDSVVRKVI